MATRKSLSLAALALITITAITLAIEHASTGGSADVEATVTSSRSPADDHAAPYCARRSSDGSVTFRVGQPCPRKESATADRGLTVNTSEEAGVLVITGAEL